MFFNKFSPLSSWLIPTTAVLNKNIIAESSSRERNAVSATFFAAAAEQKALDSHFNELHPRRPAPGSDTASANIVLQHPAELYLCQFKGIIIIIFALVDFKKNLPESSNNILFMSIRNIRKKD